MKNIFYIIIFILNFNNLLAVESKIIYKIQNEIITNTDIKKEYRYLSAFNSDLKNLTEDKIYNISKQSIVRETIKKIEILKKKKNLYLDEKFLNKLIDEAYIKKLGYDSRESFKDFLEKNDLKIKDVEKKITIESLWNELIVRKYNSKIEINIDDIKKEIDKDKSSKSKNYLLSEIVFEIVNKDELNKKYNEIKNSIKENGFENTVLIYSIANSVETGGKVGWINENSLNKEIRKNIELLNIGDLSKPFFTPNGVLLLKINNIKEESKKINKELELAKAINYQRNKQLSQYSQIYFNRVKKNLEFNE
tara:strand:- start:383 stop:1303 length:921 start_codon:yes stop_codon:yes gene_type:complete